MDLKINFEQILVKNLACRQNIHMVAHLIEYVNIPVAVFQVPVVNQIPLASEINEDNW